MHIHIYAYIFASLTHLRASLVAQMVKNLMPMQGIWVQSLGQEGPLEKEMRTHSSILGQGGLVCYSP